MGERFSGYDQEPSDGPPFDEANQLANDQITNGLVKRGLSSSPKMRRDFGDYMKWIFDPVEISDELVEKTEKLVARKGNIFKRKK